MQTRICKICEKEINTYEERLNSFECESNIRIYLCQACISSFLRWQREIFKEIFPTRALKKKKGG